MNTTVVTVTRILLIHPDRLDLEAPDGTCCRWDCGIADASVAGVLALVDRRYGVGRIPPLSPDGRPVVDPERDVVMSLDLCTPCAYDLDEAFGWHCVPFDIEVEG